MSLQGCRLDLLQRLPARIARMIRVDLVSECWLYVGKWTTGNGYGKIRWRGSCRVLHRVVYGVLVCHDTSIDYTRHLDHLCRNRSCCNPSHLEPVTPQENTRRGNAVLFCKKA